MADRDRNGYDYNHATSNSQFIALLVVLGILAGAGLAIGLTIIGVFL